MSASDTTNETQQTEADKILQEKLGQANKENPTIVVNNLGQKVDLAKPSPEEDIEKPIRHKEWKFSADYDVEIRGTKETHHFERTYTQKPLSYQAFGEFTALLGRNLDEAMSGPSGISIDRLLPGEAGQLPLAFQDGKLSLVQSDFAGVDSIIQGIGKLASFIPDFMGEAQCIWLRVPRAERALLIDIWSRSTDEGGMTMDEGEEMLTLFIEQNYDELEDFLPRYLRVKTKLEAMKTRRKKLKGA